MDVLSPVAHVVAGIAVVPHRHPPVGERVGVLLSDDGVGPGGERGASEDARRRAGLYGANRRVARRDRLEDSQDARMLAARAAYVDRTQRVAVHTGVVPRRQVDRARHILGEHEIEGLREGPALRWQRFAFGEDDTRGVRGRVHQ
jgi:hypothetical protein